MATAGISTANKLGVNVTQTKPASTTATPEYPGNDFALGEITQGSDGSEYLYAAAPVAVPLGGVVSFDLAWNGNLLTTTTAGTISGQRLGVASQSAFNAGDRGWFQVRGNCPAILVAASTPAYSQLYSTATPGQLSGTATSSVAINGIVTAVTNGGTAGVQPGILNDPEILLTM